MKISLLSCGGTYMQGAQRHAIYLEKALKMVGLDAELVDFDHIDVNTDILIFEALGFAFENEMRSGDGKSSRRMEKIAELMGKMSFVLVRHSVSDRSVFKNAFSLFEDFIWDLIVPTNDFADMISLIEEEHRFKKLVYIDYPFEFDDERFLNKSEYENTILSPSRIASCKRTHIILDVARMLYGKKKFIIAGREDGIYWYRVIRECPNKKYATFVGEYDDFVSLYKNSAFAIDLMYLYKYGRVQKSKQYTFFECIDCGTMPIAFDTYKRSEDFEAVWLPAPERKGNRVIFEVERYVEIIENSKYNFGALKEGREFLKRKHNLEEIGNRFKKELMKL